MSGSIEGRLELIVYEGKELTSKDVGKMDPYVKIELHKQNFKTKTHKKGGLTPKWDQTFLFNLKRADEKEIIHFQVFDEDLLKDDKIGRADLPISTLAKFTGKSGGHWIQIVDFDNFKKIAGYIRIGVKFDGEGWPKQEEKVEEHTSPYSAPPVGVEHSSAPIGHHVPAYTPPTQSSQQPSQQPTQSEQSYQQPTQSQQSYQQPTQSQQSHQQITISSHSGPRHTLKENERLNPNERLTSENGRYHAVFQTDGNFVVYDGSRPLWASKTVGSGAYVILQGDRNLVVYDNYQSAHWASDTYNRGSGNVRLVMQDDGNLVLYDSSSALWASGTNQQQEKKEEVHNDTLNEAGRLDADQRITSRNGQYYAIFQSDGNFVLYTQSGKPLWASGTNGSGAKFVVVQGDHNLVVYGDNWSPKWASNTNGRGSSARLVVQDDGNLVLYDGSSPLWASGTNGRS